MLLGVAYVREIAERQVWGCGHDREETDIDDGGRKRAKMPAPLKRKRGRPYKTEARSPRLAENHK